MSSQVLSGHELGRWRGHHSTQCKSYPERKQQMVLGTVSMKEDLLEQVGVLTEDTLGAGCDGRLR